MDIINLIIKNKNIFLVIGFLVVFSVGFIAGEEYKVHQIKTAISDAFGENSGNDANSIQNIKMENISVMLDGIFQDYSSIKITALATPSTDLSYASITYDVYNKAGVVIQNGYMNGMTNPKKDTKYTIDGNIYTNQFTYDDIDHIEFTIGSGKNKKVLGTWKK